MRKILIAIIMAVATTATAQKLKVETQVIDVGQVAFGSPVSASFKLKNKSSKTAEITNVETSCGCTTATLAANSIAGGKDISLTATFDGQTMGHFQKQIWVYEAGRKNAIELTMKGIVVAEIHDFQGSYPFTLGQINCDGMDIEFDDVNHGQNPTQEIHIHNNTGEFIQPVVMRLPSYLQAEVSPTRIAPNRGGVVTFTLLSDKVRDYGLTQTSVFLGKFPGDKVSMDKEITTSVVLLPSFEGIGEEQMQYMPHIELSQNTLSMSQMSGKPAKLKGEVIIQNTGRTDLEIRSMQMFTPGLRLSLSSQKIAPGAQAKLKIQADKTQLRNQHTRPRILMITNDPQSPKVVIEITE